MYIELALSRQLVRQQRYSATVIAPVGLVADGPFMEEKGVLFADV